MTKKNTASSALQKTTEWLDTNTNAEKAEYEDKLKHLEEVCHPIMMKMHPGAQDADSNGSADQFSTASGMSGAGTGSANTSDSGKHPTIEEVD